MRTISWKRTMLPEPEIIETPAMLLHAWFWALDPVVQLHLTLGAKHLFVSKSLGEKLIDMDKALYALVTTPLDPGTEGQTSAFMQAFAEALEPLSTTEKWREFDSPRSDCATDAQNAYARKSFEAVQQSFLDAAASFPGSIALVSRTDLRSA